MAEKNMNAQDTMTQQEQIMKGLLNPEDENENELFSPDNEDRLYPQDKGETLTAKDSKTYTIDGQQYSTGDIDAIRDELASRTAQENDVSAETARNALDNGKYAEGYAFDHPEKTEEEQKEDTDKEPADMPEKPDGEETLPTQTPLQEYGSSKVQTLEYKIGDQPSASVGKIETMPYIVNGNEKQDPKEMSTEELQEIVAAADAVDGRGTKESNMEALQGDYWQYTDTKEYETEKDAEKALEDEEGPDDMYKDPKTKEDEKDSDESDYDEASASDGDFDKKGPEHPSHPAPPEPPKDAPKKGLDRLEELAGGTAVMDLADEVEDVAENAKDALTEQKE